MGKASRGKLGANYQEGMAPKFEDGIRITPTKQAARNRVASFTPMPKLSRPVPTKAQRKASKKLVAKMWHEQQLEASSIDSPNHSFGSQTTTNPQD